MKTVTLTYVIDDREARLCRDKQVLAATTLEALRNDPAARDAWRTLLGANVIATTVEDPAP